MERSDRMGGQDIGLIASDLHGHCCRAGEQCREEDLVLNDDIGTCGWLPGRVSGGAVAGAGGGGRETVPKVELLLLDAWLARLVGFDVVGEEIAPVIVGHVIHVGLRT